MSKLTDNNFYTDIKNILQKARAYYIEEAVKSNWSVRVLERQIGTHNTGLLNAK